MNTVNTLDNTPNNTTNTANTKNTNEYLCYDFSLRGLENGKN